MRHVPVCVDSPHHTYTPSPPMVHECRFAYLHSRHHSHQVAKSELLNLSARQCCSLCSKNITVCPCCLSSAFLCRSSTWSTLPLPVSVWHAPHHSSWQCAPPCFTFTTTPFMIKQPHAVTRTYASAHCKLFHSAPLLIPFWRVLPL